MAGKKEEPSGLDLDRIMLEDARERAMNVFAAPTDETEPMQIKQPDGETDKPGEKVEPKGAEAPKPEEKETETPAKKADETDKKEETPAKKTLFDSHEAAEENYKNLQREMQKKANRIRELEENERATQSREDFKQKAEQEIAAYGDFIRTVKKATLTAIDALDPDEEGYDDKIADIQREEELKRARYYLEHPVLYGVQQAQQQQARQEGQPPADDQPPPAADEKSAVDRVNEIIRETGASWDWDDIAFQTVRRTIPSAKDDGTPIPFDEQVRMAIKQTNDYHASLLNRNGREKEKAAADKTLQKQQEDLPLGSTGGAHRVDKPPGGNRKPAPVSIDDALGIVAEERRL